MLRFEFVQDGEFDDPEYNIIDDIDDEEIGFIFYAEEWLFSGSTWGLSAGLMIEIAEKIMELNQSTKQQRILGFL